MSKEKLSKRKANDQKGFTLLEILVVLTIMGFLIAMVAPRLAGISGGAVDTVCDTNQNRMITYMSTYFEDTNRYPNKLTNLVMQDSAAAAGADYQIPVVSDQDSENGAEVFANELYSRNHFHIHYLNADEAAELKNMGIVTVFNLNDYSQIADAVAFPADYLNDVAHAAVGTEEASMDPVTIDANVGVSMIGCGVTGAAFVATNATERGWGEPDHIGRIVFGMGTECSLITSGIISNAAHCPGGIQNADNVNYNDYNLIIPRLEATAARMDATADDLPAVITDNDAVTDGLQVNTVAYDETPVTVPYAIVANLENLRLRTFTIDEAQETWQFATQCPEGHMYPADDEEFWGIDLDASTGIN